MPQRPQIASGDPKKETMDVPLLLKPNLQDVFGEGDPGRRRAAIDEIFTEDAVFYDPGKGVYRGHDEIDRIAGAIRATRPDFSYQPIAEPAEVGDGRIATLYLFFDQLP